MLAILTLSVTAGKSGFGLVPSLTLILTLVSRTFLMLFAVMTTPYDRGRDYPDHERGLGLDLKEKRSNGRFWHL
jgi:hypothetical protein